MRNAKNQLGQGSPTQAIPQQNDALQALREGAEQMQQQMQQMQGQGTPELGNKGDEAPPPDNTFGNNPNDDLDIDPEGQQHRAREIRDTIRQRIEAPGTSTQEREYLQRLLDNGIRTNQGITPPKP